MSSISGYSAAHVTTNSLKDLVENLKGTNILKTLPPNKIQLQNIQTLINNYKGTDWKKHVKFPIKVYEDDSVCEKYSRIKLYRDKNFELLLLCWNANVESPIHNHGKSSGVEKVLQGTVYETEYKQNTELLKQGINRINMYKSTHNKNDSSLIEQNMIHKMVIGDEQTVTLHFYAKPITKFNTYIMEPKKQLVIIEHTASCAMGVSWKDL